MERSTIKQTLEKFRELSQTNLEINKHLQADIEMSLEYIKKKYKPSDLVAMETQAIIEATDYCFNIFVNFHKRSVFDSSIYALCSLGSAYGADKYMYDNGVTKVLHPLTKMKNGGMSDNDLGEIEAFNNLCIKFGNPIDM